MSTEKSDEFNLSASHSIDHRMFVKPSLIPAALNHLLSQEQWAREKLAAHQGKVACLDAGMLPVRLKVAADGLLQSAGADEAPAVTIRLSLADLPLILQDRERAFSRVTVEGDAEFANVISQLSQSLRWEAEEDLAKVVGDVAAVRMVEGARQALGGIRSLHRKFAENAAEYLLEESPTLVRKQEAATFAADVNRLRDDAERLAKRIERLGGTAGKGSAA
jgi:ubiquinone biosynthesis protein UbiJ